MAHQYQKIYMNQIHSSSLLCQLSQMLKAQLLCDALIETGDVVTKAHRVVLVAACPMLQSLGPCETGSELKIRLPSNIQPESVQSFLQYLYEGFTTLTDINIHDVEKIARLLQVDCLVKCCADFSQILNEKTGMPMNSQSQFKYTLPDMFEFRHVRHSELMKLALNRNCKRASESIANSELKKQRLSELEAKKFSTSSQFGQVTDDRISMAKTYKNDSYSTLSAKSDVNDDCVIVDNFQSGPKEPNVFEERLELLENHSGDKEDCNDSNCAVGARVGVLVSSHTNMEKSIQEIDMENYNGKSSLSSGEKDQSVSSASVSMKELDECTPKSKMSMSSEVFTIDKHHPEKPLPNSVTEANIEVESISSEKMSETSQQVTLEKDLRNSEESMLSCVSSNRHESPSTLNGGIDEQTKAAEARQDESDVISTKQSQDSHVSSPLAESRLVQTGSSSTMSSSAHSDEMPDLSIVKIERVGRGHDIFGIDAQVDTEDNYSAVRDPADCEEYNREDYGNDELDESQLSSHSEGMQGEHDTSWYVGTFKGNMPAVRKQGSVFELPLADSQNYKQKQSVVKLQKNSGIVYQETEVNKNIDSKSKSCDLLNHHSSSYCRPSGRHDNSPTWKSMSEFEAEVNGHYVKLLQSEVGNGNLKQPLIEFQDCTKNQIPQNVEEKSAVLEIRSSSYSRQNFAWRLVRYYFNDDEIKDHNCLGRKGKPSLDDKILCKVKSLAFQYYPALDIADETKCWRDCIIAIDKGIRNTFCDYNYGSRDWLTQQGLFSDFEAAHMGYLNQLLSTFYTSIIATNKGSITRSMLSRFPLELSTHMAMPPHSRNVDITNQPEFATSNQILELMTQTLPLEEQKLSFRSYQPRQPMNREDLQILYRSGVLSKRTPECLQNKVWVEVMMYFGCLGRQVLRNLTKQSLILENDLGCGRRYFRLVDKVGKREEIENTKIYEQPGFENCPVESLMLYLSKLNPSTNVLFQQPLKPRATSASIWYSHRPIGKNVHSNMLTLICREAGIPVAYQNSSLRVFTQNRRQTADSPQFSDMVASLIREDIVLVTDDFSPLSSLQTGASGQRNIIY